MRVAVLFDGGGLARLGLELAGLNCTGYELNPVAHYLSTFVGSGRCVLADVRDVDLSGFDAVWASPPCQRRSRARHGQRTEPGIYADDLVDWARALPHRILWVENVLLGDGSDTHAWNAAQFTEAARQNRSRVVFGRYPIPAVFRRYRPAYRGVCPTITGYEFKAGRGLEPRKAARFYGRRLTLEECAYHQGFDIPAGWRQAIEGFAPGQWRNELYRAIGNGVPVYMARAFGEAAVQAERDARRRSATPPSADRRPGDCGTKGLQAGGHNSHGGRAGVEGE